MVDVMAPTRFVFAVALVVSVASSLPASETQQPSPIPLVVERVQVVPPMGGGQHSQLAITVRSTAAHLIDAWGEELSVFSG